MTSAELKLDIFRKLDSIDNRKFKNLYGSIINLISAEETTEDWDKLTKEQQEGIVEAEKQYKKGNYKSHNKVMAKYKRLLK